MAVLKTVGLELRPVEVRTDSAYVHHGFVKHMRVWKANGWARKGRAICNADLWQQLDAAVTERPGQSFRITNVKGHAMAEDVKIWHAQGTNEWQACGDT